MYRSPSQYSHAEGVGVAARGAQVTRPAARRRRPAPPSYPPAVRPSVRARADLDEEIFSLSASTRCSLSMGARRSTRLGAFVWAFYRFTPAGVIVLVIALFMAFAEKISNIPSSDN